MPSDPSLYRVGTLPSADVEVSVTAEVTKRSPVIKDETDTGTITLTYRTGTDAFELYSLRKYLDGWRDVPISNEDFVSRVAMDLGRNCTVDTTWRTVGMVVRVATPAQPLGTVRTVQL